MEEDYFSKEVKTSDTVITMMDLAMLINMHFKMRRGAAAYGSNHPPGVLAPHEQQRVNYDSMVRTWHTSDSDGNPQPPPPSFDECIAAWPAFARRYNTHMRHVHMQHREGNPTTDREERGLFPVWESRGSLIAAYLYEDPFDLRTTYDVSYDDLK